MVSMRELPRILISLQAIIFQTLHAFFSGEAELLVLIASPFWDLPLVYEFLVLMQGYEALRQIKMFQ